MTSVDKNEIAILQHSVGNKSKNTCTRNYFCSDSDAPDLIALVAKGLMRKGRDIPGGSSYFSVTDAGFDIIGLNH